MLFRSSEVIVTNDDITEYYENNKNSFDVVSYRIFSFSTTDYAKDVATDTEENEVLIKASERAKQEAMNFYEGTFDENTFKNNCISFSVSDNIKSTYENEDRSLKVGISYDSLNESISQWMFDSEREYGDMSVIYTPEQEMYSVVYFVNRAKNISQTVKIGRAHV